MKVIELVNAVELGMKSMMANKMPLKLVQMHNITSSFPDLKLIIHGFQFIIPMCDITWTIYGFG